MLQEHETQKGVTGSVWCNREGTGCSVWYLKWTFLRFGVATNAFVAGSRDTLVSRLPTSPLLPHWLAFDSVAQFHVSLGCYLQPSHQPVHLVRRGHSLWFCCPCKGCSWQLNPCNSLPMVTPRGPEQRAATEEAGPRRILWMAPLCHSQARKVSVVLSL